MNRFNLFIICLLPLFLKSQSIEADFGNTGNLRAGTPGGNGPGWIYYAPNGDRWDCFAGNAGFSVGRNGSVNYLYYSKNGQLGINNQNPGKMIDIQAGSPVVNEGLRVLHTSGYGAALLANNANIGGWFVTDGGSNYAPIWASSFNVISDRTMKKNIDPIDFHSIDPFLRYFDQLETVTYHYKSERDKMSPHIGIVAQSAPPELVRPTPTNPNKFNIEEILAVSMADWLGLNTVVIKHLRQENTKLKNEFSALKENMANLYSKIDRLEALVE